jgi:hypothetical protein
MKFALIISILLPLRLAAQVPASHSVPQVETVLFCDLLERPDAYLGKVVRVRAVFTRGGEDWVAIYCPECSTDKNLVRPEYDASFDRATPSKIRSKFDRSDTTLQVTLVGTFDPKHLSFHIMRAEQAAVISKSGSSPWRLPDKLKGRNPC